jgi:hypothetical protein
VAEGENVKQVLRQESLKGLDNVLERGGMTRQHGKGIKGIRKRSKTTTPIKNYIGKKVKLSVPIKSKRSDAFGFY